MFLGELGLAGLKDIGGRIESDPIEVPNAMGVTVSLNQEADGDNTLTYFRTNIPEDIWNDKSSVLLRKAVLRFIKRDEPQVDIITNVEKETGYVMLHVNSHEDQIFSYSHNK